MVCQIHQGQRGAENDTSSFCWCLHDDRQEVEDERPIAMQHGFQDLPLKGLLLWLWRGWTDFHQAFDNNRWLFAPQGASRRWGAIGEAGGQKPKISEVPSIPEGLPSIHQVGLTAVRREQKSALFPLQRLGWLHSTSPRALTAVIRCPNNLPPLGKTREVMVKDLSKDRHVEIEANGKELSLDLVSGITKKIDPRRATLLFFCFETMIRI